jgi:alpha-L-fucosidase
MNRFLSLAVLVAAGFAGVSARVPAAESPPVTLQALDEPDAAREARIAWHTEARFGCFVHWGVYSALGNEFEGRKGGTYAEHIMRVLKIPRATYLEKVVAPFHPSHFDAEAWVRLMRDAGMRYLIITAKHHDGFAMWPSKVSDYNITVTQFQRDPMAELAAACKKYGLKFGFYYSHAFDWEHPDAPGNDWDYDNPGGDKNRDDPNWWKGRRPDFLPRAQRYVTEKSIPQIRELIAMYHPDILWFDTPGKLPPEENRRILAAVRAADPHVVVNGRLLGNYGDYKSTADRPAYFPDTPGNWEGIPTTNESYGYSQFDRSHKPPAHFIRLLAEAVSKGGNILLNIGPRGDGLIDEPDQKILRGIGAWMKRNSASIYGCGRTPLPVQNWGTSTWNPTTQTLYLHVFHWPSDGKLLVAGLQSVPRAAWLLAGTGGAVTARRLNPDDVEIEFARPTTAPDATDSVVAITIQGNLAANSARYLDAGAPTTLHVFDGHLTGTGVRYGDAKKTNDVIDSWTNLDGGVEWKVRVAAPTRFTIAANYSTAAKDAHGAFAVTVAGQQLDARVTATPGAATFRTDALGEVDLPAGEFQLAVKPLELGGVSLMRLRQLELLPVPKI